MTRRVLGILSCLAMAACSSKTAGVAPDAAHPALAIGAAAPDFSLPGVDGKTHSLSEYSGAKVLAVVFQCNHCPESILAEDRLKKLHADYSTKGVALVAINPDNPDWVRLDELSYTDVNDSLAGMKTRAEHRKITYPYLYDGETQTATTKFGAVATPHVFVFDQARKLRYQGRIDDAVSAIDALLSDKTVAVAETPVAGCATKWITKPSTRPDEMAKINAEPVDLNSATAEVLTKLRGNGTGKLLLVNFWATWCGPCIAEFPDLQETFRMYRGRGFHLTTVSSDDPEGRKEVEAFLKKQHASNTNLHFATTDTYALQDAFDPKMGGAVPFSLLLAPNADVMYQEQGELTMLRLRRAILANLPDDKQYPGMQAYWSRN